MTILADFQIAQLCDPSLPAPMLSPFHSEQIKTIESVLDEREVKLYQAGLMYRQGKFLDPGLIDVAESIPYVRKEKDKYILTQRAVSYGLSSYGYDVRIANEFKIFTNINTTLLDPKDVDERSFIDYTGDTCIIPPNSFVLARTLEYFRMPKDVTGLVTGKSTYARMGVNVLTTVIEAGWHGELVLEYANTSPLPAKLYAGEGAAQILFFKGEMCDVPYDITRKYQGQTGITLPRM